MPKNNSQIKYRVGYGYDIHRLENHPPLGNGKPFLIGGVKIEHEIGPVGKTDADVLLHAIIDALLGALALPSMGELFENNLINPKNDSSRVFLMEALRRINDLGWSISNLYSTIILEYPSIKSKKILIRENLVKLLNCSIEDINVKIKTHEGVDSIGHGDAIEAHVCVLLCKYT